MTAKPLPRTKFKMLTYILMGVIIVVTLLLIIVAMQSSTLRVARSTFIAAPPSEVFPQVNDHHNFHEWSPFAKLDPHAQITYEGPRQGSGAIYRWKGDKNVGEGNSTIVESKLNELVRLRLEFIQPFAGVNEVNFILQPHGDQTKITWDMVGTKNFLSKAFGLIINMEKMCGDSFEQGLANLKTRVEVGDKLKSE